MIPGENDSWKKNSSESFSTRIDWLLGIFSWEWFPRSHALSGKNEKPRARKSLGQKGPWG